MTKFKNPLNERYKKNLKESWRTAAQIGGGIAGGTAGLLTAIGSGHPWLAGPASGVGAFYGSKKGFQIGINRDIDNLRKKYIDSVKKLGAKHPETLKIKDEHDSLIDHPWHKSSRYYAGPDLQHFDPKKSHSLKELYAPNTPDEHAFINMHVIQKQDYVPGYPKMNDLYTAKSIPTYTRSHSDGEERYSKKPGESFSPAGQTRRVGYKIDHGYMPGEDASVYFPHNSKYMNEQNYHVFQHDGNKYVFMSTHTNARLARHSLKEYNDKHNMPHIIVTSASEKPAKKMFTSKEFHSHYGEHINESNWRNVGEIGAGLTGLAAGTIGGTALTGGNLAAGLAAGGGLGYVGAKKGFRIGLKRDIENAQRRLKKETQNYHQSMGKNPSKMHKAQDHLDDLNYLNYTTEGKGTTYKLPATSSSKKPVDFGTKDANDEFVKTKVKFINSKKKIVVDEELSDDAKERGWRHTVDPSTLKKPNRFKSLFQVGNPAKGQRASTYFGAIARKKQQDAEDFHNNPGYRRSILQGLGLSLKPGRPGKDDEDNEIWVLKKRK